MNILHIISAAASGGAEVYVKDLAKCWADAGHVIHIGFLSTAADAGRDEKYEKEFLRDLNSAGVKTFVIGNETRTRPWLGIARVRRYVRENEIHICHTHLVYGIFFSVLLPIPVVYTHHMIKRRWGRLAYAFFNSVVDEYVGISNTCASALQNYTGRNVTTIHNAVSESRFAGYVRKRELGQQVIVVMIGRLVSQKDYMNMLHAINLLDKEVRERIEVRIAGEGDAGYKSELEDYITRNELEEKIKFVGVRRDIPQFLHDADVFLMSSSFEGLPISLIEATMSGLPCIVTDVGGCAEVVERCRNGVAVQPHAPAEIAQEISRVIVEEGRLASFSEEAIRNSHRYSIDAAAQAHVDLYRSMLDK